VDPLVLETAEAGWWERFRRGLSRPGPGAEPVWERWTRSRTLGAPHDDVDPELGLVRGAALREHQERLDPLFHVVRDLFGESARAAGDHDFTLLLADPEGVVVHAGGGGEFASYARQVRLIEGAHWSEATRGTNAIGTALAEGRSIAVRGAAHYARSFHELVCYAAPVRDIEGNVVAVLDATSVLGRADPTVGALVSAAALAMEASWKARAWARAGAQAVGLVERTLDRVTDAAVLVEAPGRIVRCNPAARVVLSLRPGGGDLEAVLGVRWEALRAAAMSAGSAGFAIPRFGSLGPVRARLEPLVSADGSLLAVAVFHEARVPRPRVAVPAPVEDTFAAVYAEDKATRAAVELGRRVAPSNLPVMLLAETGAGKERFAEALHAASRRRDGPFVAVNCGSFAPELLAAELFGYGPGAFTGADRHGRDGLLHAAGGGTLFLDEVGEMPPTMQVALLRVLEDGRYERVGERVPRKADVRILCATCRDLPAMVENGTFRRDLWFRLKGIVLRLPSLRDREDRLGLARFLLAAATRPEPPPTLDPGFEAFVLSYGWPGNVRELKSVLEVALVLADGAPVLGVEHLPPDLVMTQDAPLASPGEEPMDAVQLRAIRRALDACAGNVSAAARRLGVARSTIYRVLQRG